MSEWISVKDRLPLEKSTEVTYESVSVLITDGNIVNFGEFGRGGAHIGKPWAYWNDYNFIPASRITHWMKLPEPPK